ncbi:porin [Jannaschia ovalis]|uniref:Porin n=1 Tax=Jannaschia ovalis TaxID=3038773 RepID=A0ABY8L7X5_9RHOB|nr:porin [Jannaschia sp. GRR-S6-38]WGH77359.1 porin [Jannaschia sp. GRR-S6-38]
MKKVLFASTALVALTGAASADVTLSGFAEMGIFDPGGFVVVDAVTAGGTTVVTGGSISEAETDIGFFTDIGVTFTLSGETDNGLVFGASIGLEEAQDGIANDVEDDFSVFLSGAFGTLTMGDTDGALDWALTEVAFAAGAIADDHTEHAGYNGNSGLDGLYDGQIVRYDYSFGNFGFAISAELNDSQDTFATATTGDGFFSPRDNDDVFGIGFKYDTSFGGTDLAFGLGYQMASIYFDDDSDSGPNAAQDIDVDALGASVTATFANGFTAGLSYVTYENHLPVQGANVAAFAGGDLPSAGVVGGRFLTPGEDTDHIGVGIGYSFGAFSVGVNYGQYDHDAGVEIEGYGIAANYDLGGGAIIQAGYGHSDISIPDLDGDPLDTTFDADSADADRFSLGVRMNF